MKMRDKLKYIELFAGCGGMSLGIEKAGFELYFANELSPMASETFAYNILEENLEDLVERNIAPSKVKWISSKFPITKLKERLRENPFEAAGGKFSDIHSIKDIEGKLLVGDIDNLLAFFEKNPAIIKHIQDQNIDLVSGGPPCQSFSLAGKREKNDKKNLLPLSFSKLVGLIKPKAVLLENVKGITSPFTEEGEKYYAWLEVAKAFALEGYVPICMMLNSKYFGVAQNRPRYIMQAFRKDVFENLIEEYENNQILQVSKNFFELVNSKDISKIGIKDFKYYDIEEHPELFNGIVLPQKINNEKSFYSVSDAIGDFVHPSDMNSEYLKNIKRYFPAKKLNGEILNFQKRNHSNITVARFRLYQVLENVSLEIKKDVLNKLSSRESYLSYSELFFEIKDFDFLVPNEKSTLNKRLKKKEELESLLNILSTKKHSQRALNKNMPAPAQLTIPDDICHYDYESPRVLTVREMARIQSFPDWFEFKSKVTTGGKMRRYETPQYTQVGNAVPPLLARLLAINILNVIK